MLYLFWWISLFLLISHSEAYKCYKCTRGTSNSECLKSYIQCRQGQACESSHIIKRIGNETKHTTAIQKRCVDVCKNPGVNVCFGRQSCRYCCYGNLCNSGLTFKQDVLSAIPTPHSPRETTPTPEDGGKCNECSVGPQGPSGPRGPPGEQGPAGPPGKCTPANGDKSTPLIAFSAISNGLQQTEAYLRLVIFDEIITDSGNLRRTTKGHEGKMAIFRIRQPGLYTFQVNSIAYGRYATPLLLKRNSDVVLRTGRGDVALGEFPLGVGHALLKLDTNDEIGLYIEPIPRRYMRNRSEKYSSTSHVTFSVYLVNAL